MTKLGACTRPEYIAREFFDLGRCGPLSGAFGHCIGTVDLDLVRSEACSALHVGW